MDDEHQAVNEPEKMDVKKWQADIQNGTISDDCLFWLIKNIAPLRNYILAEAAQFILDNKSLLMSELEAKLSGIEKDK